MHLAGGAARDGTRILSRSAARAMQRREITLPKHAPRGIDGWGLGWSLSSWPGTGRSGRRRERVIGHDGGTIGQYSFLRVQPERKVAVALFTNGGNAMALYEDFFRGTFAPLARVALPAAPQPRSGIAIDAARIAGRYENLTGLVDIREKRGELTCGIEAKGPAGQSVAPAPLRFVDRNTALLDVDDPRFHGAPIVFEGKNPARPEFVGIGLRLYRRR